MMLSEKLTELLSRVNSVKELNPFFLGGMPKSGTTWIERIYDIHPYVACKGEAHFASLLEPALRDAVANYNAVIPKKGNWKYHRRTGVDNAATSSYSYLDSDLDFLLRQSIFLVMQKWIDSDSIRCVGEKTPSNSGYFPKLEQLIPEAKFVYIIRDIRDIIVSGWFFNLNVNSNQLTENFENISDYAVYQARLWNKEVSQGIRFVQEHSHKSIQVRYEDVLIDPKLEITKLYRFIDVDHTDSFVDACLKATSFKSVSGGRDHGEENRNSFYRKGIAGDWKNHLGEATLNMIQVECGPLMSSLGYI